MEKSEGETQARGRAIFQPERIENVNQGNWALRSLDIPWSAEVSQEVHTPKAQTNSVSYRQGIDSVSQIFEHAAWYLILYIQVSLFGGHILETAFRDRFWTMQNMKYKFFVNDFYYVILPICKQKGARPWVQVGDRWVQCRDGIWVLCFKQIVKKLEAWKAELT